MTDAPAQLEYAPRPGWARRHRAWVVLAVLGAMVAAGVWQRARLVRYVDRARLLRYEWQCRAHEPPARAVAFDDGPDSESLVGTDPAYVKFKGGAVFLGGGEYASDFVGYVPPCYRDWVRGRSSQFMPIVFLHDRRTPSGRVRMVVVSIQIATPPFPGVHFHSDDPADELYASVYEPGSILSPLRILSASKLVSRGYLSSPSGPSLRMLAGTPDSADATHFTIPFKMGTREGVIDGWLTDEDTVRLKTRVSTSPATS